jgi:hypothetical protein
MTIKTLATAAALAVAAVPAVASAQPTAPVAMTDSIIQPYYGIHNDLTYSGLITVAFVNANPVPATEVDFAVQADGTTIDHFSDVGTFSKGVTIRHTFQTLDDAVNQSVKIESVTFADGTTWAPQTAPRTLRQASDLSFLDELAPQATTH